MNVLMISPGFPAEMPLFTRGLARVGATVLGLGDAPAAGFPAEARDSLSAYLQVASLWDEQATVDEVRRWVGGRTIDRVECQWEPGVVLAARLREALGVPGMGVEQAIAFRDKETMKQVLDAAGIRTPHHYRATTAEACRAAAERIGYPLIIKPIYGAGSADTYPLREPAELDQALGLLKHVSEVSVEEYIEGEELTFDTVCAGGNVLFHSLSWYRPKPLVTRLNPWISQQSILYRDTDHLDVAMGRELGLQVLRALEFDTGFTHMEWFRTPSGEAIFGEIAARPPGARLVHAMNYCNDVDLFTGWAEVVCYGHLGQSTTRPYNGAMVFKRAEGEGRIRHIEGLDRILGEYGEHIVNIELTPVGAPKKDWRKVVVGDGWIVARHPDLGFTIEMADKITTDLRLFAG